MTYRHLLIALLILPLSACGLFKETKPPLPGERIAILDMDKGLQADEKLAASPIQLPDAVADQDWTQVAASPNHIMGHAALSNPATEAWRVSIGRGSDTDQRLTAQPLVVGDTVYAMDARGRVTARALETGKERWRVSVVPKKQKMDAMTGGLAFANGRLFVTNGLLQILALDAANGGLLWQRDVPSPVRAAPTIINGRVFVLTLENQMIALDAEQGSELWRHSGIEETASILGMASPVGDDEVVIAAYTSGEVYALQPENGSVIWSEGLSGRRAGMGSNLLELANARGQAVLDQSLLIVGSFTGKLLALDRRTGERVWQSDIAIADTPVLAGDTIFVVATNGLVAALDRLTGSVRWTQQLDSYEDMESKEDAILWSGLVLAGGRLITFATTGRHVELDAGTGEIMTTKESVETAGIAPVAARGFLFILAKNGELIAYR